MPVQPHHNFRPLAADHLRGNQGHVGKYGIRCDLAIPETAPVGAKVQERRTGNVVIQFEPENAGHIRHAVHVAIPVDAEIIGTVNALVGAQIQLALVTRIRDELPEAGIGKLSR